MTRHRYLLSLQIKEIQQLITAPSSQSAPFSDWNQQLSCPLVDVLTLQLPPTSSDAPNPLSPACPPVQTRPRGDTFSRSPNTFPRISTPLLWQLLDESAEKRSESSPLGRASSPQTAATRPKSPPLAPDMAANGQIVAVGEELAEISTNVRRAKFSRID